MGLQNGPIAKMSTTKLLSNTQDQGLTRFTTCNSRLYTKYTCNAGTTKAQVYQIRHLDLLENIHQIPNQSYTIRPKVFNW